MNSKTIEVEKKVLLGDVVTADKFRDELKSYILKDPADPHIIFGDTETQTNHYFLADNGSLTQLATALGLTDNPNFAEVIAAVGKISVRTRNVSHNPSASNLFIKATLNDTTSSNGTIRREFGFMLRVSQDELDAALIACGFGVQSKWSRHRETYQFSATNALLERIITVTIDKNSGYGYVAEFEILCDDESDVLESSQMVDELLVIFGLVELPQDRLERMFAYYNANWQDYYLKDKFFVVQ